MKKAILIMFAVTALITSFNANAQERPRLTYREKYDLLQDDLEKARSMVVACEKQVNEKIEEVASAKIALSNSEKERFRAEGKLASVSEANDQLRKEDAELRQKNTMMEFALMRYSWTVGGVGIAVIAEAIMIMVILLRLRKKRPQTQ